MNVTINCRYIQKVLSFHHPQGELHKGNVFVIDASFGHENHEINMRLSEAHRLWDARLPNPFKKSHRSDIEKGV
jgi:hypothetical protein